MLELAEQLLPILHAGTRVAAISVTRVAQSAPRGVGASMAVTADWKVIGSISGGCVEGDAVMLGLRVLREGIGRTASFGFDDEAAHAAGLACGGAIDVVVYPVTREHVPILERVVDGEAAAIGVYASGPRCGQTVMSPPAFAASAVAGRESVLFPAENEQAADLLLLSRAPRPRLIILGAGEHGAALCRIAAAAGYAVSVCDAWGTLVTRDRFPDAEQLIIDLPHEYLATLRPGDVDARTAVCVLTHDERVDIPALQLALRMPVGFVGALGARRTAAHRETVLRRSGLDEDAIARLHSPLGLDLGGSSPVETALSILAEITSSRYAGSGLPLRDLSGSLHHDVGIEADSRRLVG